MYAVLYEACNDQKSRILTKRYLAFNIPVVFAFLKAYMKQTPFKVLCVCGCVEPNHEQDFLCIFIKNYEIIIKIWQFFIHNSIRSGIWMGS